MARSYSWPATQFWPAREHYQEKMSAFNNFYMEDGSILTN